MREVRRPSLTILLFSTLRIDPVVAVISPRPVFLALLAPLLAVFSFASPADANTSSSGPGLPDAPNQGSIGGLEWLAAAEAAYALRRLGMRSGETG